MTSTLTQHHNVFIVGRNYYGEFGLNHEDEIKQLTAWNPSDFNVQTMQHINVGYGYAIIADQEQHLWCAGYNLHGQLGLGHEVYLVRQFTKNEYFEQKHARRIKQVFMPSANGANTFWLTDDDRVYANGRNDYNQLGIKDRSMCCEPVLIDSLSGVNIQDIKCGESHCIALDAKGRVYGTKFREDSSYDFGQNGGDKQCPETGFHAIAFFRDLKVSIKLIATGNQHSVFVDESNGVWSCGDNRHGQCGLVLADDIQNALHVQPQKISIVAFANEQVDIVDVQCGEWHTLLFSAHGMVYAFGSNIYGQCGVGKQHGAKISSLRIIEGLQEEKITRIRCGSFHSYARSAEDGHYLFGRNAHSECSLHESEEDKVWNPLCINQTVRELANSGSILRVLLGYEATWIITSFEVKLTYIIYLIMYTIHSVSAQLLVIGYLRFVAKECGVLMSDDLMTLVLAFYERNSLQILIV